MRTPCWLVCFWLATPAAGMGQTPSEGPRVTFGAFLDGYYAYDFGRPRNHDRLFTTQSVRGNEFNLNLGYLEAKLDGDRVRGRLAMQLGTSVQSNYAGEPTQGANSGPGLARHIQEAVAGVRVAKDLWVDAGIFFSHLGAESWISRDNANYTRSLIAEFSPYYQAGVKLTWSPSATFTGQIDVVNGWQNISENNDGKAVGVRLDFTVSPQVGFSVYNFIGNEQPASAPGRTRFFQGASLRFTPGQTIQLVATTDLGLQEGAPGEGSQTWYGGALTGRYAMAAGVSLAGRLEGYSDRHQVIVVTDSPDGFLVWGASANLDVAVGGRALWRTEVKALRASDAIYPDRDATEGLSRHNVAVVGSLAVTF